MLAPGIGALFKSPQIVVHISTLQVKKWLGQERARFMQLTNVRHEGLACCLSTRVDHVASAQAGPTAHPDPAAARCHLKLSHTHTPVCAAGALCCRGGQQLQVWDGVEAADRKLRGEACACCRHVCSGGPGQQAPHGLAWCGWVRTWPGLMGWAMYMPCVSTRQATCFLVRSDAILASCRGPADPPQCAQPTGVLTLLVRCVAACHPCRPCASTARSWLAAATCW
jgi:hypothetical protein